MTNKQIAAKVKALRELVQVTEDTRVERRFATEFLALLTSMPESAVIDQFIAKGRTVMTLIA